MICHKHKFIFVHINKTGGTSIEKVFERSADRKNVPLKHAFAADYQRSFPVQFDTYFKFSFVRNPWDWLVSRYFWSRDHQNLIDYSFTEFLDRLETGRSLSATADWWMQRALVPQIDRLTIDGKVVVDFVGRFERLPDDFHHVCMILGLKRSRALPHVFKSNRASYFEYYNDEMKTLVARLYAADIAAFGYGFCD